MLLLSLRPEKSTEDFWLCGASWKFEHHQRPLGGTGKCNFPEILRYMILRITCFRKCATLLDTHVQGAAVTLKNLETEAFCCDGLLWRLPHNPSQQGFHIAEVRVGFATSAKHHFHFRAALGFAGFLNRKWLNA